LIDLADRGAIRLVINLKDVSHIDSTCLSVFVAAQIRCRKRGGSISLLQTPPRIRRLLTMTRLDQFLPSFATEEQAIRHVVTASVPEQRQAGAG
jgi:anti-sigma B factor antagonist